MRQRTRVRLGVESLETRDTPVISNAPGFPPPLATSGPADGAVTLFPPLFSTGQFNTNPGVPEITRPFGAVPVQIRTAFGDINGDAILDLVAVTGPGIPTRAVVLDGRDYTTQLTPVFDPFGSGGFVGGGFAAAGDIDGDNRAEFVFTPDQGGGPQVAVYSFVGLFGPAAPTLRRSFLGIEDPAFRGGARPAVTDVNADGFADLAVAAGFGGGPRVAVYDGRPLLTTGGQPQRLVNDFFAFPGADATTLRNGAFIAGGDINADGFGDLIFGGGPGGGPRVLAVSGALLLTRGPDGAQAAPLANFFAGDPNTRGGIRVAAKPSGVGVRAEIVTGSGENLPDEVRVYFGTLQPGGAAPLFQTIRPYNQVLSGGVYVG